MKFEIKHRWEGHVLFSIETESLKLAVEAAVKSRANLYGANLSRANLYRANLSRANLYGANLYGANLDGANLDGANLSGAYLFGAYLSGASLSGAYLFGANLSGANLSGAKNYANSHDFAFEIIRRQKIEIFAEAEWSVIGKIAIHRPCWAQIREQYGDVAKGILQKLADAGFGEFLERFNEKDEEHD